MVKYRGNHVLNIVLYSRRDHKSIGNNDLKGVLFSLTKNIIGKWEGSPLSLHISFELSFINR